MARGAPPAKTATKYAKPSPRSGVSLPLGNHPGNTGGKKGRSGRKPDLFYQRAKQLCNDPKVWDVAEAFALAGNLKPLEFAASYTYEKPAERQAITGDVTIKVEFDE